MPIKTGYSTGADAHSAVQEVAERVSQADIAFVLAFCSVRYDLDAVARGLAEAFPGVPVFGCTTSGELCETGHASGGLAAASFPASEFTVSAASVAESDARDGRAMRDAFALARDRIGPYPQRFGVLFIDGLSGMEEVVSQACQSEFGDIPVVGGSAGDDERYEKTFVLRDGEFRRGEAVVLAVSTTRGVKPFQTHPFFCSGKPLVITDADPRRRVILEIDGNPARDEYARALGVKADELNATNFANAPLITRINGVDFARGIRAANADGSLTMYCAIDRGLVLRIGRKTDLFHNRQGLFDSLRESLGGTEFILGFECTLNKREFLDSPRKEDIDRLYRESRAFGFTTYGEQYRGLHMSQTLTGVAFGPVVAPVGEYRGEWPNDDLRGEIDRLNKIISALVSHDDSMNSPADSSYAIFHKTALLETEVNTRTAALSDAIAELESVNKALSDAKAKFQAIFDLLPTPTLVSRLADGLILDVNARFCEVLGYDKRAILGKRSDAETVDLWPKEGDRHRFLEQLEGAGGVLQGFELKLNDATGSKKPFIVSARILTLDADRIIIFEFQDSGDYARKINILRDLSERDALTGLPNRLLILDRLQQATRLLRRNGQRMAVAYLDLDGFKDVNDRYGHKAGDLVLTETARRLRSCVRESDTVGRMGGDEFVVLLLEPEDDGACEATLSRIVESIREPFPIGDAGTCGISVSAGYTVYPEDNSVPPALLEHADAALYAAKRAGKNRFAKYKKT